MSGCGDGDCLVFDVTVLGPDWFWIPRGLHVSTRHRAEKSSDYCAKDRISRAMSTWQDCLTYTDRISIDS